jgi:ribosomal protein L11 methyltransferase
VITLDPGLAFGTGSHSTTRLCIEWLLDHVAAGDAVLDYGCGSGVLAITAARLGATPVFGTDVDAQALRASADNGRANAVKAEFVTPDRVPAQAFDLVVANILANPLILLAPALAARVRVGGRIALSGILEDQAEAVINAYSRWFRAQIWRVDEGWVLVEGVRGT